MTRIRSLRRRVVVPVVVVLVLALATGIGAGATGRLSLPSLGAGGAAPRSGYDSTGTSGEAQQGPVPAANPGTGTDTGSGAKADVTTTDQQIVYTGSLTVRVEDLDAAGSAADQLVSSYGGRVEQRTRTSGDQIVCPYADQKVPTDGAMYPYPCSTGGATLTVVYRIPAARFTDAVAALEKLGTVVASNTNSSDVTAQVRDLDAQIRNLQATETALLGIMTKATTVTDILAVQQQLTQVQGQLEQAQAQVKDMRAQAAEGTLAVAFTLPTKPVQTQSEGWKLQDQVDAALAGLIAVGQMTATGLVYLGIVGLPILVVLAVLLLVVARLWRVVRPARPAAPAAPAHGPEA